MPACYMAAVNESDVDIGVINQRIGERHSHGTSTHHEIVGCDGSHHRRKLVRPQQASSLIVVILNCDCSSPTGAASIAV